MARVQGKFFAITLFHYPQSKCEMPLQKFPPKLSFHFRLCLNQSWTFILTASFVSAHFSVSVHLIAGYL